jgi:ABC-type branched-subunit amino acid transport system substrate-binding protein
VPFIYASATNSFAENKTYVFKDYPDATDLCALLMRQALKSGNQKVALFGTNAEFTIFCKEGAEKVAPLAAYDTYDSGETDFRAHLTKLKSSGSTALIMSAFASDCLNMFKQMRELRFTPQVFSPYQSFACGNTENVRANADMLVKAYGSDIALYENRTDEQFVSFRKRLEEHGWTAHIGGSALMYDTVMELAKAWSGCQDADCAAKNLRQLNYQGVSGMISYGGDQIVSREVMLTTFENGVWKRVE